MLIKYFTCAPVGTEQNSAKGVAWPNHNKRKLYFPGNWKPIFNFPSSRLTLCIEYSVIIFPNVNPESRIP